MACTEGRTLIIPVRLGHLLFFIKIKYLILAFIQINNLNALANTSIIEHLV